MKFKIILVFLCLVLVPSVRAADKLRHPFQEKRKEQQLEEQAKDIPLYEEMAPDRPFEILHDIRADGLFSQKHEKIYLDLKVKVLQYHGDAVVNVYCHSMAKFLGMSCYGTVVRWKSAE